MNKPSMITIRSSSAPIGLGPLHINPQYSGGKMFCFDHLVSITDWPFSKENITIQHFLPFPVQIAFCSHRKDILKDPW
jgi:hypothetical protein